MRNLQFFLLICGGILLSGSQLLGQNNTSSPYSIFGVGEIEPIGYGAAQGMGSTGIGIRATRYLNPTNPASYSILGPQDVILETGFTYKRNASQTNNYAQTYTDFNIKYFSLAFPAGDRWGMSFGLRPYSSIGYQINATQSLEGVEGSYEVQYTGTGGLSQFYLSNAFQLTKNLSLGLSLSYLWGYVEQTEALALSNTLNYDVITENAIYLGGLNLDYGLQYTVKLKNDWAVVLGAVFDNRSRLGAEETELNYRTYAGIPFDTLRFEEDLLSDVIFPNSGGLGISLTKENQLTIAADVHHQRWAEADLWENATNLENSTRYSVGVEFVPNPGERNYFDNVAFRIGGHLTQSNVELNRNRISDYGMSAGLGLPMGNLGRGNISYEYKRRGTTESGLILENIHAITLSVTLKDIWFIKQKVN